VATTFNSDTVINKYILFMLQKDTGIPLHIQLANVIRQQIVTGDLRPNQRIASERVLCEKYGVSRITVRHALGILSQEGLISTVQGKGTYVTPRRLEEQLNLLSGFSEDMSSRGFQVSSTVLEAAVIEADDETAMSLSVMRGAEIVHIYRLRLIDGLPTAIQRTYLTYKYCPGILNFDLSVRSLYDILGSEYNLKLASANMRIKAQLAKETELERLQMEPPASVLVVDQTTFLDSGEIIEHTVSIYRGDRFTLITSC
jgi:GntR family transcriptional regulator